MAQNNQSLNGSSGVEPDVLPLVQYMRAVWRRRILVMLVVLGVTLPAVAVSALQPPVYSASASVVLAQRALDSNLDFQLEEVSDARVTAEVATINSDQVASAAALRGATGPVQVTSTSKSNLLVLTSRADSPQAATTTANAVADAYVDFRVNEQRTSIDTAISALQNRLQETDEQVAAQAVNGSETSTNPQLSGAVQQQQSLQGQLSRLEVQRAVSNGDVTIVNRAVAPIAPVSPKPVRDGALGVILGLLLGITIAILLETTRRRRPPKDSVASSTTTQTADPMAPPAARPSPAPRRETTSSNERPVRERLGVREDHAGTSGRSPR